MNQAPNTPPATPSTIDLDPVILEPSANPATHRATVVWLHGLGADGHDFVPFAREMGLLEQGVRFVFPQAPVRPVTINGGLPMRAWYDVRSPEFGTQEDAAGIQASSQAITALLNDEVARGVPPRRLVLAGFSQGGAIALHTGLRLEWRLAGIIALSAYLPLVAAAKQAFNPDNAGLPVFRGHGTHDPVIPIALGHQSNIELTALGLALQTHDYPMEHSVSLDEMVHIRDWLNTILQLDWPRRTEGRA